MNNSVSSDMLRTALVAEPDPENVAQCIQILMQVTKAPRPERQKAPSSKAEHIPPGLIR
jgi:hypothetical protein